MSRYVGVKNNNIYVVSDNIFVNNQFNVIEVPTCFDNVSSRELITTYKFKENIFKCKTAPKLAKDLKVALVTNWKMRCGIATYAEFLYSELIKHVGDYKFFVERNNTPTGPINYACDTKIPDDKIVACWNRGDSLKELVKEIKAYDPDVVLIQHEFGIWPNARYWLSLMNQLSEFRVIVTMHSVFHHRDKTICEAAMPEIVVHLPGAIGVLKDEKGVPGKVYAIPHGSFPCESREKLWNFYKSDRTFMQFGFGFRYKGWENCVRAASILKKKYKDVFFTGLFSESPFSKVEHELYYNELMDLVSELDLEENVAILRGYQSDASLDSYLRTNQATIFPYVTHPSHEVFGASGAARVAMSKGLPVITSSVNHFSDLPTIKADSPEEMAAALDHLFSDTKFKNDQIELQINYLNDTTWKKVALKYIEILETKSV